MNEATETVLGTAKEKVSLKNKEVTTEKPAKRQKAEKVQKSETLVYCGPTIKGIVTQFAHYNNGLPKKLNEYSQQNKAIMRLIVPIEKFVETKKNIQIIGTIENLSFNKIQKGE
ncbi:MAG: hypothetical protein WCD89_10395 [Anaerocolumna sp.]